jgi:hypothetical protein
VAWGAKDINLKQSTTLRKEGPRIATTFGFDWSGTSKAIEFNNEELEGCTKIGIVTYQKNHKGL